MVISNQEYYVQYIDTILGMVRKCQDGILLCDTYLTNVKA